MKKVIVLLSAVTLFGLSSMVAMESEGVAAKAHADKLFLYIQTDDEPLEIPAKFVENANRIDTLLGKIIELCDGLKADGLMTVALASRATTLVGNADFLGVFIVSPEHHSPRSAIIKLETDLKTLKKSLINRRRNAKKKKR